MSDSDTQEHLVGYKKPPKRSQFKKGQSGNPGGRPRGSKSFVSLLAQALEERVVVNENGRRRSISKREALAKQFANKGASGDFTAAKLLLELVKQIDDNDQSARSENQYRGADTARERIEKRLQQMHENLMAQKGEDPPL